MKLRKVRSSGLIMWRASVFRRSVSAISMPIIITMSRDWGVRSMRNRLLHFQTSNWTCTRCPRLLVNGRSSRIRNIVFGSIICLHKGQLVFPRLTVYSRRQVRQHAWLHANDVECIIPSRWHMGQRSFILPESFERTPLRVELAQLRNVAQVVCSDRTDAKLKTLSENQKIGVFRRGGRCGEGRRGGGRRCKRYLLRLLSLLSIPRDVSVIMNTVVVQTGCTSVGFVAQGALGH